MLQPCELALMPIQQSTGIFTLIEARGDALFMPFRPFAQIQAVFVPSVLHASRGLFSRLIAIHRHVSLATTHAFIVLVRAVDTTVLRGDRRNCRNSTQKQYMETGRYLECTIDM